jgi:hypothetical protein
MRLSPCRNGLPIAGRADNLPSIASSNPVVTSDAFNGWRLALNKVME